MEKIVIQNNLKPSEIKRTLIRLEQTYSTAPTLSRRSFKELNDLYFKKQIIFCFSGKHLASFIIKSTLGSNVWELSGAYTFPEFRKKSLFENLILVTTKEKGVYIGVTFIPWLAHYLENHGFRKSNLLEISLLTRGRFFLTRLNWGRIGSIISHLAKNKAIYLIKNV
jgi:hypothetical protein